MKQNIIIIALIAIALLVGWCSGNGFRIGNSSINLPFNPDSLSKSAKVIDKALVRDKAKEVKSDSVAKKQSRKIREVLKSAEIIPCDTFRLEILKEVPILIAADSAEIANLRRVNCDLEAKVGNLVAGHANDSTTIASKDKQLKKRFWKGFKIGFVTGSVLGGVVVKELVRP